MVIHKIAATFISACALGATLSSAQAQQCAANFNVVGTPMLTALTYRTFDMVPRPQPAVLADLASAVAAEGFQGIRVDKGLGAVSALQETSGSGRPQTLRVTARKAGNGTRVDAVFMVQPGQIAPEDYVRQAFCRVISGARR